MNNAPDKLDDCKHCGGSDIQTDGQTPTTSYIYCQRCGSEMHGCGATRAKQLAFARARWNTSAAPTTAAMLAAGYVPADQAVSVKPLEWVRGTFATTDDDNGPLEGIERLLEAWRAERYVIVRQGGNDGQYILRGLSSGIGLCVPRLSQAKLAAHHDRRILSAITALEAHEWQDIADAPTPGSSANIYLGEGLIITALWVCGKWMSRGEEVFPTHYMPLPDAPKVGA